LCPISLGWLVHSDSGWKQLALAAQHLVVVPLRIACPLTFAVNFSERESGSFFPVAFSFFPISF
jgi:hypothetical protein